MGVKFSQLPVASTVAADDYLAVLDSSETTLKRCTPDKIGAGIELTQAEYNALTPEQQANGMYFITDGVAPSPGGGGTDITQAEYDQLTPEQKASGTYYITDGVAPGSITVDGQLNSSSSNPVSNSAIAARFNQLSNDIGTNEPTSVAAYDHLQGEYFMWAGQFVKSTAGIAEGDTIAIGTNVEATSVSAALNEILPPVPIVTFADGTDEQIEAMLEAYYNGQLTWEDMGWSVGDTRTIHLNSYAAPNPNSGTTLPAQNITVVIVDHEHHVLATPINGHAKGCISVQFKEALGSDTYNGTDGTIYINGDSTEEMSFTKWSNLYMRTYMNSTLLGAFTYSVNGSGTALGSGTSFKDLIKPSVHNRLTTNGNNPMTANTQDGSKTDRSIETVTDTLFLPSYPEIFGNVAYAGYLGGATPNSEEGTQLEYFETTANRIKYANNNGAPSGTALYWWNGSASSSYAVSGGYYWSLLLTNGDITIMNGRNAVGLVPSFVL